MKSISQTFKTGFARLRSRGKAVLIIYGIALFAVSGLDGAALVVLAQLISSSNISTGQVSFGSLKGTFSLIVFLFVARSAVATIISWFGMREFAIQEVILGQENFASLGLLSWEKRSQLNVSDYSSFVDRGPFSLIQGFLLPTVTLIAESLTAVVILLVLLTLQPVTAISAVIFFLSVAVMQHKLLSVATGDAGRIVLSRSNVAQDILTDAFQIRKLLEVMPSNSLESTLRGFRSDLASARVRADFMKALPRYFMEAVLALGFMVVSAVVYVFQGESAVVPAVILFAASGLRLLPIINRIQGLILQLFAEHSMAMRALDARFTCPNTTSVVNSKSELGDEVLLSIEDVSFTFIGASQQTLSNISLEIVKGKKYAFVGPSGAGKTTLADMCLGIITPTTGQITFLSPEVPINIGYVPQDTHLILSSLLGNVALEWSVSDLDLNEAERALSGAGLVDIDREPKGKNLGQHAFSGGQRQRVGLARALYRRPGLLVLDEATSSLDSVTEAKVMAAVRALPPETTVITIAHRLSTIRDCDEIIYLANGKILGQGNYEALLMSVPAFAEQVRLASQAKNPLPGFGLT